MKRNRYLLFCFLFIPFLVSCFAKKESYFSGIVIWQVDDEVDYELLQVSPYLDLLEKYNSSIVFNFKDCVYSDNENHSLKFSDNKWEKVFIENFLKGYESGKGNIYFSVILNNEIYTSGLCRIFNVSENFYPTDTEGSLYLLYCKETEMFKFSYDIIDDGSFEDYISPIDIFPFKLDYKPIEHALEKCKTNKCYTK